MPTATPPNPDKFSRVNQQNSAGEVEIGAVAARQGFRGRRMLYVLWASLVLALAAYIVLDLFFFE